MALNTGATESSRRFLLFWLHFGQRGNADSRELRNGKRGLLLFLVSLAVMRAGPDGSLGVLEGLLLVEHKSQRHRLTGVGYRITILGPRSSLS